MSRIDDLIRELCPDGVTVRPLGEVAALRRGTSITRDATSPGDVPVVAGGKTAAYYHNVSNREGESIVAAGSGAYAGFVSWWTGPIFVSDAFSIKARAGVVLPKFCFYWLQSVQEILHALKSGGGVPHVYPRDVATLQIPIPPLQVQSEIVRILDSFTELAAELEAELAARRRQYVLYRDSLLAPSAATTWMTLGDFGRVRMCKRVMKAQTSVTGDVPFFKIGTFGGEPDAFITRELFEDFRRRYPFPKSGDVLISAAGTIGRTVPYDGRPAYFQDSNIVWLEHREDRVLNRFLYYLYQVVSWSTDSSTIQRLYNDNILRTAIPVPPIDEQRRIVAMLDKFDALVNDPSIGLPAELAARRKQYEHYRDRLLTFEEAA